MQNMTSREIRDTFLGFFAERAHQQISSSSLLPAGDATLLFTNAGMNQFKDVFAGRETRSYSRACSSQKCVRAGGKHNDLENVGYTARHHTFFEMLGNFSFGDYFKRDAIRFAWDLLVDVATVCRSRGCGLRSTPTTTKRLRCGRRRGRRETGFSVSATRTTSGRWARPARAARARRIHFDRGDDPFAPGRGELVNSDADDIIEIWNLVFMQYERDAEGAMHPLPRPSIDTGAGLERLVRSCRGRRRTTKPTSSNRSWQRSETWFKCSTSRRQRPRPPFASSQTTSVLPRSSCPTASCRRTRGGDTSCGGLFGGRFVMAGSWVWTAPSCTLWFRP